MRVEPGGGGLYCCQHACLCLCKERVSGARRIGNAGMKIKAYTDGGGGVERGNVRSGIAL